MSLFHSAGWSAMKLRINSRQAGSRRISSRTRRSMSRSDFKASGGRPQVLAGQDKDILRPIPQGIDARGQHVGAMEMQ